ncbi:nucleoside hydrolase-like domain-containing protein [Salinisphaera sp. SPP-AMP-43]|uniref:DUF1593 domain-containing protein n=1 Tax=Salinisphaera sp. SPP-AMP-43 TaxID=3121288 RepID=UPI003C6E01F7
MVRRESWLFCLPILLAVFIGYGTMHTASASNNASDTSPPAVKAPRPSTIPKARLIVLTDMTSLEAGVREPDDAQSMIRLMLYANEFDIEGLIATSGLGHGQVARPEIIHAIVDAYGQCHPNLMQHAPGYPSAAQLRDTIKHGQPRADRDVPINQSLGHRKDTQASQWIIQSVDKPDPRPVWIVIWGGSADLAQALWTVRETRSPAQVAEFVSRIRVVASNDQDSTGPWIKSQFPALFYITRKRGARGMYHGGDRSLVGSPWVQKHIKGHGALGRIYPDYRGGDVWSSRLGLVHGIKGGDSATYMGLIRNGLNVRRLTWANWGGRVEQDADNPQHFHDAIDRIAGYRTDISPLIASVYRWRPDFQPEYAARFDWCTTPYDQANHAPVNQHGIGVIHRQVRSGDLVSVHSGSWQDPDGHQLSYHWQTLPQERSYAGPLEITPTAEGASARFIAPEVLHPRSIHMLLTVKDNGQPRLTAYKRIHVTVQPRHSDTELPAITDRSVAGWLAKSNAHRRVPRRSAQPRITWIAPADDAPVSRPPASQ